ncbi:CHAD domain-containing protein [Nocardioides psychrotolerans]|uniref:CHAD domain-containing protein n=1 Tax=Nocardioides psychrotolerans TaxID=1005945 RepID=A0A1I3ESA2_9ACTN|nr:CHAD domain-containing protein [Nocardioides psychrotolerans]
MEMPVAIEFVIDDVAGPDHVEVLSEALHARAERSLRERTVWLDTHDWRLFGAGLLLEHQVLAGGSWLVLRGLDGDRIARQAAARATVTADTLQEGAIGHRVRDLIGLRALLPRASVTRPAQVLLVLDGEQKTVARVVLEGPATVKDGTPLGLRARLEPLRGYDKAARRVEKRLAAIPGLSPAESFYGAVFAARGLDPRGYRSKPDLHFDPEQPAGEAFASTFAQLLAILRDNLDGTRRELDSEFLHDFRVTVRRSRALVKLAGDVLDDNVRARYAAELRWLGDRTSLSRDLDVHLLGFDQMAGQLPAPEVLDPFRDQLRREARTAHAALNRALRSPRFADLLEGWERDLTMPRPGPATSLAVADVADRLLSRSWKRVHKRGRAITVDSSPEALHDLRKRCKELRYLLELFSSLYKTKVHRELVRELKRLQDNLGEFQDSEAQRFTVAEHAAELARNRTAAATLMGLGRLEQQLETRQDAARREFADRWERFDRRDNERLYAEMVAAR